jgi:hypothetical protein
MACHAEGFVEPVAAIIGAFNAVRIADALVR